MNNALETLAEQCPAGEGRDARAHDRLMAGLDALRQEPAHGAAPSTDAILRRLEPMLAAERTQAARKSRARAWRKQIGRRLVLAPLARVSRLVAQSLQPLLPAPPEPAMDRGAGQLVWAQGNVGFALPASVTAFLAVWVMVNVADSARPGTVAEHAGDGLAHAAMQRFREYKTGRTPT